MSRDQIVSRSLLPLGALLLLFVGLPACGEGEGAPDRLGGTSSLRGALQSASRETGVPSEILAAVAHVESRLNPEARGDGDHGAPGQGLLQLVPGSGPRSLDRGARLAQVATALARTDLHANLRAGAHLLAEHGRQSGSRGAELGTWYDALFAYGGGAQDPEAGRLLADSVFRVLRAGLEVTVPASAGGGTLVVPADPSAHADVAIQRSASQPDYPEAEWLGSPNFNSRNGTAIDTIVIHTTQGGFSGSVGWLRNPASQVSSHYVIRSNDGHVVQLVEEKNRAWHASCWNSRAIGIEHEGFVEDPGTWYTDAMYESSARLVRNLCDRHGIPCDRAHVKGHGELTDCNNHTDPGGGWDWDRFMTLVNGGPPRPRLAASYVAQSQTEMDLRAGEEVVAWVEYKNDGSATWSPDATLLGTTEPRDRESAFVKGENWLNPGRPSGVDAATAPGGVGRFSFVFVAPAVTEPTTFVEHVGLVQEGEAWFGPGDADIYFTIHVQPAEGATPPADPPTEPADPLAVEPDPTTPTLPPTSGPPRQGTMLPPASSPEPAAPAGSPTIAGGDLTGGCQLARGAAPDASWLGLMLLGLLALAARSSSRRRG